MQTPASMVMGIVFAPLGLVLIFMAAITPQWREGQTQLVGVAGAEPHLLLRTDGLWESCLQVAHSELKQCWPVEGAYQSDPQVRLAQGLVLSSLFLCGAGIVLASVGVRCWTDLPLRSVVAAGGLLVALSGLLSLTALGVYTHNLGILGMEQTPPHRPHHRLPQLTLHPAGSLYFGWVGGCVQVVGGVALLLSFKIRPRCPSCTLCSQLKNKQDTEVYDVSC
ncbi:claudin-23 [Salvelinus sp. IW2-2015]|uniref:claudin-23 n=1 Tax=Salvelinus sp. IW2-2015 TaxID=2691554 RepID=UPI000CEB0626|nr:claudin-23-like [Salvelinus alpinus]